MNKHRDRLMAFDTTVFQAINDFARATPWLHGPMLVFTGYGIVLVAALLAGTLWVARQRANPRMMAAALWAPLGMMLALAINQPISDAVGEQRPCRALSGIAVLGTCGKDFSFPSDHAVMAGATAAGILLVTRGLLAWVAVLAALALAFSRIYIAAHYPHDVLAGLLLGAAVSVLGYLMVRRVLTRIVLALQGTRMRPMLTGAPAPDGSREPVAGGAG